MSVTLGTETTHDCLSGTPAWLVQVMVPGTGSHLGAACCLISVPSTRRKNLGPCGKKLTSLENVSLSLLVGWSSPWRNFDSGQQYWQWDCGIPVVFGSVSGSDVDGYDRHQGCTPNISNVSLTGGVPGTENSPTTMLANKFGSG